MLKGVLDFSKIESNELALEAIDFELHTVVEDVFDLLSAQAYDKGLEVAYCIRKNVPAWVEGDPGRLRQILVNLVSTTACLP